MTDLYTVKSIVYDLKVMENGLVWRVYNGKLFCFWINYWVGDGSFEVLVLDLISEDERNVTVADFLKEDNI